MYQCEVVKVATAENWCQSGSFVTKQSKEKKPKPVL